MNSDGTLVANVLRALLSDHIPPAEPAIEGPPAGSLQAVRLREIGDANSAEIDRVDLRFSTAASPGEAVDASLAELTPE